MAHLLSGEGMCIFSFTRQVCLKEKERQCEYSLGEVKCKAVVSNIPHVILMLTL